MTIRPALTTDIDIFYELFSEIMHEGYAGYSEELKRQFLEKDYNINNFYLWLERFFRLILLAFEEETLVGFLVGDYTYGGVGFISWIGVKSKYRKSGIGKALYLEYEKFAVERKAHLIELYTYEKVEPFYIALGFERVGKRDQGYFGQRNLIMNKKIGNWDDANLSRMK